MNWSGKKLLQVGGWLPVMCTGKRPLKNERRVGLHQRLCRAASLSPAESDSQGWSCCTYYVWCRLSTMPAFARRPKFSVMNMASLCTCVSAKPRLPKRPAALLAEPGAG